MIITRNFALGANEFGQFRLPLMREFLVGLTLGLLAGVLTLILIFLAYQNIAVGIRVGITLTVSMTVAALFGMFIPVTFKKIGIDPAIASGPLVTSGCDMLSVSLYLLIIISLNKGLSIFGG
jgi:magnesium transporter